MTEAKSGWTAILLAGQRPGVDPLAHAFDMSLKALVPVAGRPMVARVVDTLLSVPELARIIILCQQPDSLRPVLPNDARIQFVTSSAGISESILAIAGTPDAPWPLFVTTADHPLLTRAIISDFLASSEGVNVAVAMVERQVVLAGYPDNKRTWIKLRGGAWSGANLFALSGDPARRALQLWVNAEKDRKQLIKLFWHFGPLIALRAITRTISLHDGIAALGRRLGLSARAVALPYAEAAIDVDKPSDHALVETILAQRG